MIGHRTMALSELEMVLDWAADEGWNPGLDDAAAFHAADPGGFFLALEGDTPVAAISVVNHSDDFAFLGLYLVRPAWRASGIGLGLWNTAITHAGARTIGLDGVEAQQANYARSGFAHAGGTTRYGGRAMARCDPMMRAASERDIPVLTALEASASGWPKPAYLEAWLRGTETRRTFLLEDKAGIAGFATIRRCRSGAKIGPLVCKDAETARRLIEHGAAALDADIMIDVPSTSTELGALCRELGLAPGFRTARMYRGKAPAARHPCYAVTSLELG
jgi:GNAT superfamily N-acetyltransferase